MAKALSVHNPSEQPEEILQSEAKDKYEDIFTRKSSATSNPSSIPTTKPRTPPESTNKTSVRGVKELDIAKSKPFVPAKVLMSQSTSSAIAINSSPGRKEGGRHVSSTVQKLIQAHNQAVAAAATSTTSAITQATTAAAAAAAVTGTLSSTPEFKQNVIINNQPASTQQASSK